MTDEPVSLEEYQAWEHDLLNGAKRKPDIEFKRKVMVEVRPGHKTQGWRTYGHIYWRPLIVHILGRTIIGRKHLG